MKKTYFFGWTNIKKFITEIIKMYSNKDSYFSKKRVESSIAFIIGQWGMIYFLLQSISTLSAGDFAIWAGVEFAVAGYIVHYIQQEKKVINTVDTTKTDSNDNTTAINTVKTDSTEK